MNDTRERIKVAGAELLRRNGYSGTGIKQISAAAQAKLGSLYHFFPGGKEQLSAEVIGSAGAMYGQLFDIYIAPAEDADAGIEAFFDAAAQTLADSDYADACPIATVALEVAGTNETLRLASAEVFDSWVRDGTETFARFGLSGPGARRLTLALLSALEGAFLLARTLRSTEPMSAAAHSVRCAAAEIARQEAAAER